MKKRRKKVTLPRVSVLAMSHRELLAFCEAVASLRTLAHDLTEAAATMMVAAELFERRHNTARKAAATRKATQTAELPLDGHAATPPQTGE